MNPSTIPAILQIGPILFALLAGMAVAFIISSLRPQGSRAEQERLETYSIARDGAMDARLRKGILARTVLPGIQAAMRFLGGRMPLKRIESTRQRLVQAGNPAKLDAIDFYGLRLLLGIGVGIGAFIYAQSTSATSALTIAIGGAGFGYMLPSFWLGFRVRKRRRIIETALPDCLDMLTISVEAGLAFESAMLRVSEHWDNELTHELSRSVLEMRVGTPRAEALRRMADRCDVAPLRTFVAVLVQSSQLGVSIADVLHAQATLIRQRRRQRIERLAKKASIKMLFPLVFLIFPALFVVILGPTIPRILDMLSTMGGGA